MDKYTKIKQIGSGSYGEVFLVRNNKNMKQYVLKKIFILDEKRKKETLREIQLLTELHHPNIVEFHESFVFEEQYLCIIMAYCERGDLFSKLKSRNKDYLDEKQILDWFIQISLALHHMHSRKVIHRDLKTQNIFLTSQNIIKLGDFGIARTLEGTSELARTLIGTPYYMSPEVFENKSYDYKTDIWSLGCCLYEMIMLKHAFESKEMPSLIFKVLKGEPIPIANHFSQELRDLVSWLLEKDPNVRPTIYEVLKLPFIRTHIQETLSKRMSKRDSLSPSSSLTESISTAISLSSSLTSSNLFNSTSMSPSSTFSSPSSSLSSSSTNHNISPQLPRHLSTTSIKNAPLAQVKHQPQSRSSNTLEFPSLEKKKIDRTRLANKLQMENSKHNELLTQFEHYNIYNDNDKIQQDSIEECDDNNNSSNNNNCKINNNNSYSLNNNSNNNHNNNNNTNYNYNSNKHNSYTNQLNNSTSNGVKEDSSISSLRDCIRPRTSHSEISRSSNLLSISNINNNNNNININNNIVNENNNNNNIVNEFSNLSLSTRQRRGSLGNEPNLERKSMESRPKSSPKDDISDRRFLRPLDLEPLSISSPSSATTSPTNRNIHPNSNIFPTNYQPSIQETRPKTSLPKPYTSLSASSLSSSSSSSFTTTSSNDKVRKLSFDSEKEVKIYLNNNINNLNISNNNINTNTSNINNNSNNINNNNNMKNHLSNISNGNLYNLKLSVSSPQLPSFGRNQPDQTEFLSESRQLAKELKDSSKRLEMIANSLDELDQDERNERDIDEFIGIMKSCINNSSEFKQPSNNNSPVIEGKSTDEPISRGSFAQFKRNFSINKSQSNIHTSNSNFNNNNQNNNQNNNNNNNINSNDRKLNISADSNNKFDKNHEDDSFDINIDSDMEIFMNPKKNHNKLSNSSKIIV